MSSSQLLVSTSTPRCLNHTLTADSQSAITPHPHVPLGAEVQATPSFDPLVTLPARLKRILDFELVEMSDMLPDTWHEELQTETDSQQV